LADVPAYHHSSGKLVYDANPIQPDIESTLENLTDENLGLREAIRLTAKTDANPKREQRTQPTVSPELFELTREENRSRIRRDGAQTVAYESKALPESGHSSHSATSKSTIRVGETSPKTDDVDQGPYDKRKIHTLVTVGDSTASPAATGDRERPKRKALSHYHPPPAPEPFDIFNLLARMTIGTVTVLGVGVVGLLTARRWLPQGIQGGRGEKMRLEESLALGKRCCVHLVSVENRKMVVVMDGGGVKSVETLNDPFPDIASWDSENPEATNGTEQAE